MLFPSFEALMSLSPRSPLSDYVRLGAPKREVFRTGFLAHMSSTVIMLEEDEMFT